MPKGVYSRKSAAKTHPCPACGKLFAYKKAATKCVTRCRKVSVGKSVADMGGDVVQILNTLLTRLSEHETKVCAKFAELDLRVQNIEDRMSRGRYKMGARPRCNLDQFTEGMFLKALPEAVSWFREHTGRDLGLTGALQIITNVLYVMNGYKKILTVSPMSPLDKDGNPMYYDIHYLTKVRKGQTADHARELLLSTNLLPDETEMASVLGHPLNRAQKWSYYAMFLSHYSKDGANTQWCRNQVLKGLANFAPPMPPTSRFQEQLDNEGADWWENYPPEDLWGAIDCYKLTDDAEMESALVRYFTKFPGRRARFLEGKAEWE